MSREVMQQALEAIQIVIEMAFNEFNQDCCRERQGVECCGNPIQVWPEWAQKIMNDLDEPERALRAELAKSAPVAVLPPVERDESCNREYIPLPGGWEVQTKGDGSSFRIADTKSHDRWVLLDASDPKDTSGIAAMLTRMAYEIRAAVTTPREPVAVPDARKESLHMDDYERGLVEGWNACREAMLTAAPQPPAPAVDVEAIWEVMRKMRDVGSDEEVSRGEIYLWADQLTRAIGNET